jgi:hypothetical protein
VDLHAGWRHRLSPDPQDPVGAGRLEVGRRRRHLPDPDGRGDARRRDREHLPAWNPDLRGRGGLLGTNDQVGFVYSTSTGGVNFARSTNDAATFTQSTVSPASDADTTQAFPVVANAGNGKLAAVWLENVGDSSRIRYSDSTNWGSSWSAPRTLVSAGTSVYPWVAASGSHVAISVYHTDASGTSQSVPENAQWFEGYLESNDGGATFSPLQTVDSTPVKSGPISTEGTGCSGDRELLDFQSVALDNANLADLTYTRSLDGESNTEVRLLYETGP